MANFQFKLEKVLAFEASKKLNIEKELAEIQTKINAIQAEMDSLFEQLGQTNHLLKEAYLAGTSTTNIIIHKAYLNTLSNQIAAQKRELEKQEYFKKEILMKLKAQNIEVKKLEKFKDNQLEAFQKQEEKRREKSLDEFISSLISS